MDGISYMKPPMYLRIYVTFCAEPCQPKGGRWVVHRCWGKHLMMKILIQLKNINIKNMMISLQENKVQQNCVNNSCALPYLMVLRHDTKYCVTVEDWEWIINFIQHFSGHVNDYPLKLNHVSKWDLWCLSSQCSLRIFDNGFIVFSKTLLHVHSTAV